MNINRAILWAVSVLLSLSVFGACTVVAASADTEVEEFVRQTRFESDPLVQNRLPKMACLIYAQWRFERTNTMRILEQTFGRVTRN